MTPMARRGIYFSASLPFLLLLVALLGGCGGKGAIPQPLPDAAEPKEGEEPAADVAAAWLAAGSNYGGMKLRGSSDPYEGGRLYHMPYGSPGKAGRGPVLKG